ncbi:protein ALP1-like [Trichonephila clavipes]|nr:protein ALP1-like [Trichonephila clavipes]
MVSDDQVILALGFAAICDIEMRKAKNRKIWQRKWLQRRIQLGCYKNLMKELALEVSFFIKLYVQGRLMDRKSGGAQTFYFILVANFFCRKNTLKLQKDSESYRRFLRMDVSTFEELVALVSPSIERKNTSMRKAIPAAERIALTLRYLTTDETQTSLNYQFRIAQNTISGIIPAVCVGSHLSPFRVRNPSL